jgi:hypothetical protein
MTCSCQWIRHHFIGVLNLCHSYLITYISHDWTTLPYLWYKHDNGYAISLLYCHYHWTGNTPKKDLVGVRSYTVVMSFDDHGYKTCNVKAKGLIKWSFAIHGCDVHNITRDTTLPHKHVATLVVHVTNKDITVTYSHKRSKKTS